MRIHDNGDVEWDVPPNEATARFLADDGERLTRITAEQLGITVEELDARFRDGVTIGGTSDGWRPVKRRETLVCGECSQMPCVCGGGR